ncbi:MAG: dethiobiotin synthase [Acidobacteria bacterium]|nr:dethiobiotin synthase [Acidobacteriota bacterium]
MLHGVFITGTDTAVGKTVLAAAFMHRYRGAAQLCYWKPIQTGIDQEDDTAKVRMLGKCADAEIFDGGVRLARPLSPHLAARLAGQRIVIEELLGLLLPRPKTIGWVVEGAGGILAPVNETHLMIDLMERLALPVVVAARAALGTINHTLLTLEALRRRSLRVAGVVMVGDANSDNRAAIEQFGSVSVLGEMPRLEPLTSAALGRWAQTQLDPTGLLTEFLRE